MIHIPNITAYAIKKDIINRVVDLSSIIDVKMIRNCAYYIIHKTQGYKQIDFINSWPIWYVNRNFFSYLITDSKRLWGIQIHTRFLIGYINQINREYKISHRIIA